MTKLKLLLRDCDGAITVDWVTLTGAVLLVGIMVVYAIYNNGVSSLVSNVNSTMTDADLSADVGVVENQNP